MKRNTNEVFVVNQPSHSILSIVFVNNSKYPLSEESHNRLYELSKFSDLFFVFKSWSKEINLDKFSNLYSGCAWIVADGSLVETFLKVGLYSTSIFKCHTGTLVFPDINDLVEITEKESGRIQAVNMSSMSDPILKLSRLTAAELFDIYKTPKTLLGKDSNSGKYTIWKNESKIVFFRPSLFNKFSDTLSDEYIRSFSWSDIGYFIASGIRRLGLETTEADITNLEVGKL